MGLLVTIAILFVASIPWYREPGVAPSIWFGLPDWFAVAIGCYVAVAIANALAWLLTDLSDPEEPHRDDAPEDER